MNKYSASRTIIQHAVIEAESVEDARRQVAEDSEAVAWEDTSNRFMVFENLDKEYQDKQLRDSGPPSHFQQ